jgi:hypothetical protein
VVKESADVGVTLATRSTGPAELAFTTGADAGTTVTSTPGRIHSRPSRTSLWLRSNQTTPARLPAASGDPAGCVGTASSDDVDPPESEGAVGAVVVVAGTVVVVVVACTVVVVTGTVVDVVLELVVLELVVLELVVLELVVLELVVLELVVLELVVLELVVLELVVLELVVLELVVLELVVLELVVDAAGVVNDRIEP